MSVSFLTGIGPRLFSSVSICPCVELSRSRTRRARWKDLTGWNVRPVSAKLASLCVNGNENAVSGVDVGGVAERGCDDCVEVIMVGSRSDSLIDFCSASPLLSPILRFWCISGDDSGEVRLQERPINNGVSGSMENISMWQPCCKAVILVVSAAYGQDHVSSLEVLSNVKSRKGLVVGLILKPFSFEGKRRQEEVNALSCKIQNLANFCIVLDTDALLENDLVTLDEAWKASNNSALMVMNAISILFSEKHKKVLNTKANINKELQLWNEGKFMQILNSQGEARIAFGAGYNIEASLLQATSMLNFLGVSKEDTDGLVFCTIGTSASEDSIDINNVLQTVRSTLSWKGEVILSVVLVPSLEPNVLQTTIIFFGFTKQCSPPAPQNGLLFRLGQYFPFIFNIFKNPLDRKSVTEEASPEAHVENSPASHPVPIKSTLGATTDYVNSLFDNIFPLVDSRDEVDCESNQKELLESYSDYSTFELNSEGYPMLKGEQLARGILGPTSEMPRCSSSFSDVNTLDVTVSIQQQPVGVKTSNNFGDISIASKTKTGGAWGVYDDAKLQHGGPSVSELSSYFQKDVASTNIDAHSNSFKKQGGLSVRAASMLESERDTYKKWSRVVEMKYRGGTYIGHIEGGLPEGKGRLLLVDGSIYHGAWRYGKRCGMGTFYFNNGDVFKGLWRDDVMHGKGWIYFHTGDRWFVNFWKGKPNGEGRFYSRLGDIFFGNFKDGWRHGHFLRIDMDGSRYQEVWDEGVLVSEKQLDPDDAED